MLTRDTKKARRVAFLAWPILAVCGLCFPIPLSADVVPAIRASGTESPWAGIGKSGDVWNQNATAADLVGITLDDSGPDGSGASAYASSALGSMRVEAQTYRNFNITPGQQGYAGAYATADFVDY